MRISDCSSDVCSSDLTRKSRAVFGQVDWPITDKFTVTGGLRYTDDKARFAGSTIDLNPYGVSVAPARFPAIPVFFDNKTSDNNLSGRSEEHTSELQSLMRISYAVICLKKKNKTHKQKKNNIL